MNPYLKIVRPVNGIMAALAVVIGFVVSGGSIALSSELVFATLAMILLLSGGMVINDYYDYEIDLKRKKHRPIPSGEISRDSALAYSIALFAGSMIFAYFINLISFMVIGGMVALLFIYSNKLSKKMFTGNMLTATCTGLAFVFGAAAAGDIFAAGVLPLAGMAFFATLAREIYKSIQDMDEDKLVRTTLPMKIGVSKSAAVAAFALVVAVALSFIPYLLGAFSQTYLILISFVNVGLLYTAFHGLKGNQFAMEVNYCKVFQFIALITFLISALKY